MKYIIKNLRNFRKQETGFFLLCILCVFLSFQMMLAAYGLFGCYTISKLNKEQDLRHINLVFSGEVTKREFTDAILKVPQELNDKVFQYYVEVSIADEYLTIERNYISFHVVVDQGKIAMSEGFLENCRANGEVSEYLTPEQEANGDMVALVYQGNVSPYAEDKEKLTIEDNTVRIFGQNYEIVGTQSFELVMAPFLALKDDTVLIGDSPMISMKEPVTKKDYDLFRKILTEELDGKVVFPEFEIPDLNQLYRYNTILLVKLFIIGAAALNFALLYRYMMIKRRKQLAIYRLCGLGKGKTVFLYLGECASIVLPVMTMALCCFHWMVLPVLTRIHEDIGDLFTGEIYMKLVFGYLLVTLAVLLVVIGMELKESSLTRLLRGKAYE